MLHAKRCENVLAQILCVWHAADLFTDIRQQRETIIAVVGELSRVRAQTLRAEHLHKFIVVFRISESAKSPCTAAVGIAHQTAGVVHQHPDGDLLIALVCHPKIRQIGCYGRIEIDLFLIDKLHHGGNCHHLAGGGNTKERFRCQRRQLPGGAGYDHFSGVHDRKLKTLQIRFTSRQAVSLRLHFLSDFFPVYRIADCFRIGGRFS